MILLFGGLVVRQSLHTKEIPRWGSRICAQDSGLNPWKRAVNAGSSTISSWSLILMAGLQRNDATWLEWGFLLGFGHGCIWWRQSSSSKHRTTVRWSNAYGRKSDPPSSPHQVQENSLSRVMPFLGVEPGVGDRKWQPTPVFLPGKSHGQRSLVGYSLWGHKELDTTEWLTLFFACVE